ncbi:MAG: TetR/AcrR family transcriptional regulator [Myxococcota bacterium]
MASPGRTSAPSRARRAQQARQALYRDLVIEAAESTFAEHGVEGSKMEQIAEAAGLSLGTVYAVFRGKAAIVDALHERRLREVFDRTSAGAQGLRDPLEKLIAGVRAYVEYFLAHPDYLRMYISEGTSWGMHSGVDAMPARARAWAEGIARQERLFRQGVDAGIFHAGDPNRMARTMAAMQQVRLADWLDDDMREDPDTLVAELELQLRRCFCRRESDRKLRSDE